MVRGLPGHIWGLPTTPKPTPKSRSPLAPFPLGDTAGSPPHSSPEAPNLGGPGPALLARAAGATWWWHGG